MRGNRRAEVREVLTPTMEVSEQASVRCDFGAGPMEEEE